MLRPGAKAPSYYHVTVSSIFLFFTTPAAAVLGDGTWLEPFQFFTPNPMNKRSSRRAKFQTRLRVPRFQLLALTKHNLLLV